jgi:hypothetical protein
MKKLFVLCMLALAACGKSEEKKEPAAEKKEPVKKEPKADEPTAPEASDADYVRVRASHHNPKPADPVIYEIPSFRVVAASFADPANLEGATADLELDLTTAASDKPNRDSEIKGPDYLDVEKQPTATIHIDNVKKSGDQTYTADATVKVAGEEKKLSVSFEVLSSSADSIRVKGSHTFPRLDFGIGAPVGEDSVAADLTIELQLTLKKTT